MFLINSLPTHEEDLSHSGHLQSTNLSSNKAPSDVFQIVDKLVTESRTGLGCSATRNTSRHAENKVSGGTAISALPKSDSLQQLSTNILPSYHPPPFPPQLFEQDPCEAYSCSACGDTFVLQSSLNFHMQRRSVLIRFNCDSCPSVQAFYNRCSLLCHIRAHADKAETSDISKAHVLPLPHVLMEGIQTDVIQNLEDEDDDSQSNSPPEDEMPAPAALLEVSISEGDAKMDLSPAIGSSQTKPKEVVKTLQCSECSSEFMNAEERQNHFNNKGKLPTVISPCAKCGIICPSECSSKAHKRLHLQISPYVCPECGDNPDRYWENFQRHLTYQCFHYARSLSYKCPLCQQLFTSSHLLKQHSLSNHTDILYKCQMCPMAFTNFTNFQVHKRKVHAAEILTGSLTDPLQMYKCSVCDVVFLAKDDSDTHWDTHLKENICQYAYACSECQKVLDSKMSLREHLRSSHLEVFNKFIAFLNLPREVDSSPGSGRDISLNKSRIECLLCHGAFSTRQGHSLHVTKSHSNHKYPCGVCNKACANRMSMISHGKEHLRENVSLCLLCQNKPMKPPESLDFHLLNHVERIKHQTFCPVCETAIFTFSEALQHLRTEHLLSASTNVQRSSKSSVVSGQKRERDSLTSNGKGSVSTFSTSNKPSPAAKTSFLPLDSAKHSAEIGPPSKWLKTGENCCGKCDFRSVDRKEFKKHILIHKEKKSTYQCQECGLCFVVEPSLKKHLKIAHKIFQVDQYLTEEGTNHVSECETIPETAKSNDLECTVCFEVFVSEALLKTHMRSHGMAFIQAKKNSSA